RVRPTLRTPLLPYTTLFRSWDLGGLMLEMYRRDQFRQDLVVDRCTELVALEERIAELDALLSTAMAARHRPDIPAERRASGSALDRKSTRRNSSHVASSYAV